MKKLIYMGIIVCFSTSCFQKDAFYMEGQVETFEATSITNSSAVLHGNLKIVHSGNDTKPDVTARGFVLRVDATEQKLNANTGGEGNFSLSVSNLLSNTNYRVQAFVTIAYNHDFEWSYPNKKTGYIPTQQTFYGNIIEFTTPEP